MRSLATVALLAFATPTLGQDVAVRFLTVKSTALGEERTVLIHLPPGHEPARPYPVLYFTDGDTYLPLLATLVRYLAENGRIPELILVGITHRDRTYDLTPTRGRMPGPLGRDLELGKSGGADRFLAFLADELVPLIEKRYRTQPFRILAGHSFGGLFALHAMQARPGFFQAIVAASPALVWDGNVAVRRTREVLEKRADPPTRTLLVARGDEGRPIAEQFEALRAVLASGAGRMRWRAIHFPGEDHGSAVLPAYYAGLREIFDGYRMPQREEAIGPDGGVAAVEAHYRALSTALGFDVAPPEPALIAAAHQCELSGDRDGALRALRRATELYPASPAPQRELGDLHEGAGELDRAADAFRRALELATARGERRDAYAARLSRVEAARGARRRPDGLIGVPGAGGAGRGDDPTDRPPLR